jgi:type 2A phosphatase activator TIP41
MATTFPKTSLSPQRGNGNNPPPRFKPPGSSAEVLERASSNAKAEENYCFVQKIKFNAIHDHILPSRCNHQENIQCQVCLYKNELELPELPEMVFPNNKLIIKMAKSDKILIEFITFDALKRVDTKNLPNVQVGASASWSETRKDHIAASGTSKPFDWTYTSDYAGTLGNDIKIEETDLKIDIETLKRRDPIFFYTQLTLYEDELADHGCSLMAIKVRVMPEMFFVLCRFYLRVDHVMVRVCDTRLFGETNSNFLLREWTLREAKYSDLSPTDLDNVRDSNIIWQSLPIIESKSHKIYIE